jgi:hypothetical protein
MEEVRSHLLVAPRHDAVLEEELQSELDLPGGVGLGCDLPEGRIRYTRVRIAELHMVEYIECLCTELHLESPNRAELFE